MHKKKITIGDYSAVVTGLLLGFNIATYSTMVDGCTWKCIWYLDCKTAFGGLGQNFMNPALGARCFLFDFFYKSDDDIRL